MDDISDVDLQYSLLTSFSRAATW